MTNDDENVFAVEQHQELSRRRFLTGSVRTLGAALASAGIYEMIDTLVQPPERVAFAATQPWPLEQYIIENVRIIKDNGSGINSGNGTILPKLHPLPNHLITPTFHLPANAKALQGAQQHLESVLLGLEQKFAPTPSGLGVLVAWGLPYFHNYIPSLGKTSGFFKAGTRYPVYMPADLVTSKLEGHTVYAVQQARTFPSPHPSAVFG